MKIMGILNVTPDSFSDGGKYIDIEKAIAHAKQMVADGADIIDVGGESTRPGATLISQEEELMRVIPVIKELSKIINVPISIDTYKAEVARQAIQAGATIINDIGGAKSDPDMPHIMAESGAQVILMHYAPHTEAGQIDATDIHLQLKESIDLVTAAGVLQDKIIIDPGIGFGKTMAQNMTLIQNIKDFKTLGYPVMLATSKKRAIRELAQTADPDLLGIGTVATTCHAFIQGIDYVRVHHVKENKIAIQVMAALNP